VRSFLGRSQNMTAFQHWMGEEFASNTAASGTAESGR